jgi:steroid Delta-isomerase
VPGQAQQTIERFWQVQDSGDYTQLVELFADDALLEDPIWGVYRGREAILGFMTTMVKEMGERKIHFTVDEICGDDHACWARWTMHSPAGTTRSLAASSLTTATIWIRRARADHIVR